MTEDEKIKLDWPGVELHSLQTFGFEVNETRMKEVLATPEKLGFFYDPRSEGGWIAKKITAEIANVKDSQEVSVVNPKQKSVESAVRTLREAGISAISEPNEVIRTGNHKIGGKAGAIEKF